MDVREQTKQAWFTHEWSETWHIPLSLVEFASKYRAPMLMLRHCKSCGVLETSPWRDDDGIDSPHCRGLPVSA